MFFAPVVVHVLLLPQHYLQAYRLNERIARGQQTKEPVQSGQRVPYVVHRGSKHNVSNKLGDRADDPDWVKAKRLRVDRLYYAQQMVEPAVERMCVFLTERSRLEIKKMFKEARRRIRLQLNNQRAITSFFK